MDRDPSRLDDLDLLLGLDAVLPALDLAAPQPNRGPHVAQLDEFAHRQLLDLLFPSSFVIDG